MGYKRVLEAPNGEEYVARDAVTANNLIARGYKPKETPTPRPRPRSEAPKPSKPDVPSA